jgi:hypothetical protein
MNVIGLPFSKYEQGECVMMHTKIFKFGLEDCLLIKIL